MPFNARDWYWMVGGAGPHLDDSGAYTGDDSRVFSSKRNAYVAADDAEYVAWRDEFRSMYGYDPTTKIDTEENLASVLEPYGVTPAFAASS